MAVTAYTGETPMKSSQLAASDLSTKEFYAVTVGVSGVALAGAGVGQVKVLHNKPAAGDPCFLVDLGECKLIAGAAVAVGALLMTDSSGRFITYVDNGVNVPVGECRVAAGAAGDLFTGLIWPTPGSNGAATGGLQNTITAHAGGTTAASGTPLVAGWNRISVCATDDDTVTLPAATAGSEVIVVNDGAAPADVWAAGTDTIDGVSAATPVAVTNAQRAIFICITAGAWLSLGAITKASAT